MRRKFHLALLIPFFAGWLLQTDVKAGLASLILEQSTNGMASWQVVPLTTEMLASSGRLNSGVAPEQSPNAFFRLRIDVQPAPQGMVAVATESNTNSSLVTRAFYMAKYETTWGEWKAVRDYSATNNGTHVFDLAGAGSGSADDHPVHSVSWYEAVKWCNAKSLKDGLQPVYYLVHPEDGGRYYYTEGEAVPMVDSSANGYRLPTYNDLLWAAVGGVLSEGYTYSGGNDVNEIGWYYGNSEGALVNLDSGRGTWAVGTKKPNELGVYDLSGNVWEMCWDSSRDYDPNYHIRLMTGGSWNQPASWLNLSVIRENVWANGRSNVLGFRVIRYP